MRGELNPLRSNYIDINKVTNYLLSVDSILGRHKARFFVSFGFDPKFPNVLISALKIHVTENRIVDVWQDEWGMHYDVRGPLVTPDGRNPTVRSCWLVGEGEIARFITAFPD